VEEDELRKDEKKSWKTKILRLIHIVSIFFIAIQKFQKIGKNFYKTKLNTHTHTHVRARTGGSEIHESNYYSKNVLEKLS